MEVVHLSHTGPYVGYTWALGLRIRAAPSILQTVVSDYGRKIGGSLPYQRLLAPRRWRALVAASRRYNWSECAGYLSRTRHDLGLHA